jgi:hypothetical protein
VVQLGYYDGRWPWSALRQAWQELKRARAAECLWY